MISTIVAVVLLVPLVLCLEVIFITFANFLIEEATGYNLIEMLVNKIFRKASEL